MRRHSMLAAAAAAIVAGAFVAAPTIAQTPPFGQEEDTSYAAKVWEAMVAQGVAGVEGDNVIRSFPYEGAEPHGFVLETLYSNATIDGHTGALVVKRNYGPEGVDVDTVQSNPAEHLGAVTIMFKREAGYDDENANWFWAKYLPDGTLDKNPAGLELAGRIAKGNEEAGCIACHTGAGEDMLFTTDGIN